jgi:branched-chain amino acid transport system permease protein
MHESLRPRSLLVLPRRGGRVSIFEIAIFAGCVAIATIGLSQNLQDIAVLTFLWAGLALAWNIAGGYAGLISFGHAAFFGIGAYASTILFLHFGLSPWIGIWCGGLLAAGFGAVLAIICARLRGPFFILSTLAAAEVVRIAALNWASLTGGPEGLSIPPVAGMANMVFHVKNCLRDYDVGVPRGRLCDYEIARRLAVRLLSLFCPR